MLRNWTPRFTETFLTLKYTLEVFSIFFDSVMKHNQYTDCERQAVGSERDGSVNLSKWLWRWVWLIGLSAHFVFFCFHCLFYVICKQYQRGLRRRRQQTFSLFLSVSLIFSLGLIVVNVGFSRGIQRQFVLKYYYLSSHFLHSYLL